MIRFLHILAITALIASAAYAYSIKYEALAHAEQIAKLKAKLQRERDAIQVLKAEWSHLNKPDRLQQAVDKHLDLQPLHVHQLARLSDLPAKPPRADEIGRKLEALGLLEPTVTPKEKPRVGDVARTSSTTPAATRTPSAPR